LKTIFIFFLFAFTHAHAEEKKKTEPCFKLGGKIKIANDKDGKDFNLCVFGRTSILDKTIRVEYFNKQHTLAINELQKSSFEKNKKLLRKQVFDPMNKETDAVRNCRAHGGTTLTIKDFANEYIICRFSDYSGIEVNAFWRGNKDIGNVKLLKIRSKKK